MVEFLQLSDGRFDGDGIDEAILALSIPKEPRRIMSEAERAEAVRVSRRKYRMAHPEQRRAESRNRRAMKRSTGKITNQEWVDLCDTYGNKCLCCGSDNVKLTLDHIQPLALGGANTIDNAQPLCAMCNSIKGAKWIDYR